MTTEVLHERIDAILTAGAARFPDWPAVRDEAHVLTFAELDRTVDGVVANLEALGTRAGDRVLVIGSNRVETVVLLFALSRLRAWTVAASDRIAASEIDAMIAHCAPRLVVHATAGRDGEAAGRSPNRLPIGVMSALRFDAYPESEPERDTRVAALLYTSGTTGAPKAVMLSHASLLFIARTQAGLRRYAPGDCIYCALPIAHAGGLASITLGSLAGGACLQLARRFDAAALARALRDDGVTVLPGVPSLHVKFAEWLEATGTAVDAPRLRMVTTASSPLQLSLKASIEALYRMPLQNGYGLTETSALVCQTLIDIPLPDNAVGMPLPGVRMRVVDEQREDVAAGEVGEVMVNGPNLFLGYYRNDEATRAAFSDGWFATGDLGRVGRSGELFIVGRLKDMIKHSSYSVYPVEVESALDAHPAVALSSVVGRPRGADEEVVAFVELTAGACEAPEALLAFAATRLAPYKRPALVHVLPQIPTLHNGKADKAALRRMALALPPR